MSRRTNTLSTLCVGALLSASAQLAYAADVAPAKPPAGWWDTFTVGAVVEAGITVNPDSPSNGLNFGSLYTDKANSLLLNQFLLTAARPIDPTSKDYDFGFKFQGMYGSDARYTHFLGELDYAINSRYQLDVVEANLQAHLPWLTSVFAGGIDAKVGQFISLQGEETIDPTNNFFYSHSYIYNFGIAAKLTGAAFVAHVIPELDIYAGFNTGNNTGFGWPGDNNAGVGFEGGIGLNLLGGNLTALATTNIAPQNPATPLGDAACACYPSNTLRYLNDLVVTWKATDKLTFVFEGNYAHDDTNIPAGGASAYGAAGYASYAITDWLKLNGRAEVWRDNNNFFVSSLGAPGNFNFVNSEHGFLNFGGYPPAGAFAPAPTTYLELTAGLNISAPPIPNLFNVPSAAWIKSVMVRPEIRYDSSLNGTTPFNVATKSSQWTFGGDILVKF
ncbi:outer membrane beta-barrel protein [Methylocella tundrae]|uniref:Putative beta-barrel porin-2, OmpL-like. bbp2 n=1 Tax=Methylocella tundrae TaxID=227605 RepID=A0A4U8Z141_METTU|nr:outer membrane beta-barrel protein [Methylocella tundrae]WPP06324.1 outer membrane beta-barrel protein [Methylocella tundrae]VFU09016.1 putative beta-barrel porin-2, OmpL-like. bbp2 [Methylocella tundrae]